MIKKLISILALTTASIGITYAQDDALKQKLESVLGMNVTALADSPVEGLKQATTDRGLFYVSDNGRYFMQARIFDMQNGMQNITESALADMRLNGIKKFKDDAIRFEAKNEKHEITVFTDTTCGYCRKMHKEIDQLNALGITVNYLAFPRNGLSSPTYKEMVSVWCADDTKTALTEAKQDKDIAPTQCENTVAEQYQFGQSVGVTGTPNIILDDGTLIPGYQPAGMLSQALDAE